MVSITFLLRQGWCQTHPGAQVAEFRDIYVFCLRWARSERWPDTGTVLFSRQV